MRGTGSICGSGARDGTIAGMADEFVQGGDARERIIQAAAELIHRDGVAGAGVGAILDRAGAGKGQLYHYFDDKADLVREAEALQARRIIAPQVEVLDEVQSVEDLRAWAAGVVDWHRRGGAPGCPVGSFVSHIGSDDELQRRLDDTLDRWVTAIEGALRRLQEAGALPAGDPPSQALLMASAIQGGALLARTRCDVAPLDSSVEAALKAVGA